MLICSFFFCYSSCYSRISCLSLTRVQTSYNWLYNFKKQLYEFRYRNMVFCQKSVICHKCHNWLITIVLTIIYNNRNGDKLNSCKWQINQYKLHILDIDNLFPSGVRVTLFMKSICLVFLLSFLEIKIIFQTISNHTIG